MAEVIRLALKARFREPLPGEVGYTGREKELAALEDLIANRTSATVLVAGQRGVGKTALVSEALTRAEKRSPDLVVVRIALPHVYSGDDDAVELRSRVLRGLSRAFYFAVKGAGKVQKRHKRRCQSLYREVLPQRA